DGTPAWHLWPVSGGCQQSRLQTLEKCGPLPDSTCHRHGDCDIDDVIADRLSSQKQHSGSAMVLHRVDSGCRAHDAQDFQLQSGGQTAALCTDPSYGYGPLHHGDAACGRSADRRDIDYSAAPHQTVLQWNDGLGNDAAAGDFRLTRPSASRFILHHHLFIERTDIAESERPACADCCGTWDPGGIDRCEPRYTIYAAPL